MKYSDFGATCAEDLEQDDWTKTKPTFHDGKIKVLGKINISAKSTGHTKVWPICYCEKCASDPELFGDGLFTMIKSNLTLNGGIPCGCASTYRWSQQQREVQVTRKCLRKNLSFIGWVNGYKNARSKLILKCNVDGCIFTPKLTSFINNKEDNGCPSCAVYGFDSNRPATIYLVKWTKDDSCFLKFGITNRDYKLRIANQQLKTEYLPEVLYLFHLENGKASKEIESGIKQNFSTHYISKELFPDGYTETTEINNLEDILSFIKSKLGDPK